MKYPRLKNLESDSVIDYDLYDYLEDEEFEELYTLTELDDFDEILEEYEGYTIKELLEELDNTEVQYDIF